MDNEEIEYWSGCNRWINQGNNEHEPIGTAQSMHDCNDCNRISYCKLKKTEPTWEWNEEIEKQMNLDWENMIINSR